MQDAPQPLCYVIMPFSSTNTLTEQAWHRVFEAIFKPTFEILGYKCIRSDVKTGSILQDIITNIHQAQVIFADLTDNKPNVLYELGIAHTITTRVIMASQRIDEYPSDLKRYGIIQYNAEPKHEDIVTFQRDVKEALLKVNELKAQTSPVFEYLQKTMRFLEWQLQNPIAIMQCSKCGLKYEVKINETTQSDFNVDTVDNYGRRIHPIGIEHKKKGLCGHWECACFLRLKG